MKDAETRTRPEVLIVLWSLACIAITGTWAILLLIYLKADAALLAIATGIVGNATGALGAVLSTTGRTVPNSAENPVKTEVVNTPQNPVQTETAEPGAHYEVPEEEPMPRGGTSLHHGGIPMYNFKQGRNQVR